MRLRDLAMRLLIAVQLWRDWSRRSLLHSVRLPLLPQVRCWPWICSCTLWGEQNPNLTATSFITAYKIFLLGVLSPNVILELHEEFILNFVSKKVNMC